MPVRPEPDRVPPSVDGPAQVATDLSQWSLEDKVGLLSGQDFWSTRPVEHAAVPSVVLTDGPHGVRRQLGGFDHIGLNSSAPATCFPPAVAVGSSWDPQVAARIGNAIGVEARILGVQVVLGPGVNIKRSPLCGRNFEYYSEDPLLSGVLGAAHVRGQQSQGVGASVKHFAANNQETDRMRISADVDERTLREIYLPAFERVVTEAAPATVMAAYNKINGVYATENRWLLTDLLRGEWGFAGAVVSDWGAVNNAAAALQAGMDLDMPGPADTHARQILAAVRAGELDEAVIDTAAHRVLALSALVPPGEVTPGPLDVAAHHALARELAAECGVLLKNDAGVLPLMSGQRVAVIGEFAVTPRYQGGGSSHLSPTRLDIPLDELSALAAARDSVVDYAPGFSLDDSGDASALRAAAVQSARGADVAVIFAGLRDRDESEGFDRHTLDLPAAQTELIRAVAAAAPRTVVVLANGGTVSMSDWAEHVDAILEGFLLGQAGGGALADLLFGVVNPSGRLAETIPDWLQDSPSYLNFPGEQGHVRYGEGVMVGYRWYETVGTPARYPFGYGLSYTTFATSDLTVETGDDSARVGVTITNTGPRTGKHVVQLYVATTAGPVRRPTRELRAFTKIELAAGETRTVHLDLDRRAFAYYDIIDRDWVVAPGEYVIQVGDDAATITAAAAVTLVGDDIVRELTLDSTVAEWVAHPIVGPTLLDELAEDLAQGGLAGGPDELPDMLRLVESMPMRKLADLLGGESMEQALLRLMQRTRTTAAS